MAGNVHLLYWSQPHVLLPVGPSRLTWSVQTSLPPVVVVGAQIISYFSMKQNKSCLSLLQVVNKFANIATIPTWFDGSLLNYAENLLKYNDDQIAIYGCGKEHTNSN